MRASEQPFEHREILTDHQTRPLYRRVYPLLGWELVGERTARGRADRYELQFIRPTDKAESVEHQRLQMQIDAQLHDVERMERKRQLRPAIISYGVGILGSLLAAAGICAIRHPIARTLLLTALLLLAIAYPLYARLVKAFGDQVQPFIQKRLAEIDELCRRAAANESS